MSIERLSSGRENGIQQSFLFVIPQMARFLEGLKKEGIFNHIAKSEIQYKYNGAHSS